ncbi:MAG: tRNA lysidine(34) synthetase TilS [Chloroflexi bacterium]|nr:tRNA lysidine(34) synthetase TilS [Chloroflexota bacterium]
MDTRERARASKAIVRRVTSFLEQHALSGKPVVVAVSGGPDSVCLLHSAHAAGLVHLQVAHLDHAMRSESRGDAQYVASLCKSLGLPLTSTRRDVPAVRKRNGGSLEAVAREVRYAFLAEVARKVGAKAVLLGHTADDQVETVLLHLIRGTGINGLRGMDAIAPLPGDSDYLVARPLLATSRRETLAYCTANSLHPRRDESNRSRAFLRNRLRLHLLPSLRRYNPSIDRAILRLAKQAGESSSYLDKEAARHWKTLARVEGNGLSLDRVAFRTLPLALQIQVLRRAFTEVRGHVQGIEEAHLSHMAALASGATGKRLALPDGLEFAVGYGSLELRRKAKVSPTAAPSEVALAIPGVTKFPGWTFDSRVASAPERHANDGHIVWLDVALATRRLTIRTRRPGDRFQPLGMAHAKKLQDVFVDAKVPREQRDSAPLVCANEQILWIPGLRISEKARVPKGALEALRIEFRPR